MRYLTEDMPGTGGRIKQDPEDFCVSELPLYLPSGKGEHVYLYVEKRGLGAFEAADRIARAFGLPRRMVGMAGLKDAHAVSRQWMSLLGIDPEKARQLELPDIRILEVSRHRNKLKIGHLAGNRFEIRIRGLAAGAELLARPILEAPRNAAWRTGSTSNVSDADAIITSSAGPSSWATTGRSATGSSAGRPRPIRTGSPRRRRYDAGDLADAKKRFGGEWDHLRVLTALARTKNPQRAARALSKQLARLFVSAFQSDLFNQVLDRRLGEIDRVEAGDLAYIHGRVPSFASSGPRTSNRAPIRSKSAPRARSSGTA